MYTPPNRRRIFLMRHAEAAYVSEDGTVTKDPRSIPLTPTGREQARIQAEVLAAIQFDKAICSGLPRTVETLDTVLNKNEHRPPSLESIPALEEINSGPHEPAAVTFSPTQLQEIANPWSTAAKPGARFLGGELFSEFARRVTGAWDELMHDESWQTLLLVLHGAVNRMIFNHISGLDWHGAFCIEQDNGCINIIDVDEHPPERFLIRGVNITSYNLNKTGIHHTNMEATALRIAQQMNNAQ